MITLSQATSIVLNHEISNEKQLENHYFALHSWIVSYSRRAKALADQIGIDDAKIMLIRNKGLKRYQDLESDDAKAEFRKQVNDALIILRAFSQGIEIGKTIEMNEADEERKAEIRKSDKKYVPQKRVHQPEAKGLAAKAERLGINFDLLMKEVRNS